MSTQAIASNLTLEQVVAQILASRRISRLDQRLLMVASSQAALTAQQENLISQVYELLHRGLLKVVG
jgi:hypothetical protein